jgi:hypothetical protein
MHMPLANCCRKATLEEGSQAYHLFCRVEMGTFFTSPNGRLRVEIAEIQELNQQYRFQDRNDAEAHVAHGQRHERLQAIRQELAQLAALGRKVRLVEEMKEKHRSRLHLVKEAS